MNRRMLCLLCLCAASAPLLSAQKPATPGAAETRAARAYDAAVKGGPLTLRAFLDQFPKGADLHVHLSGAVYAETFLKDAAEDGLCVDVQTLSLAAPPCTGLKEPAKDLAPPVTTAEQNFYDRLVNAFSMRSFVPTPGYTGHDQFFSTFNHFGILSGQHTGEWVDEVALRSASQNQQYLELMVTPPYAHAKAIADQIGWNADFATMRRELLAHGLRDEVNADRQLVQQANADRLRREKCSTAQAEPACRVTVRYLYQVLRRFPPQDVFAQALLGFETVQAAMQAHDDTWVGINFVMREDGLLCMRDYTLQMQMVGYLHTLYPQVHISLHAGELAPGLVPPEGLRFHVRQAVELAHAERIGHGVDVMYETGANQLLREMAAKHVMVEINLTSNAGILGVKGDEHPFPVYLAHHVPVALSTDDEGVSRIDLTHEYVRAALTYHLSYAQLKMLARTGIEHSFLPGASLWAREDAFTEPAAACRGEALGGAHPRPECIDFLAANQKAAEQWKLERRFRAFEAAF
ncbi:MAG TPA: adenosine deaminase [Terracidiphilus sp.]|nr:adenosine deaminase [Terracidiphilus sp.]